MQEWITLTAADGHMLSAWEARPASPPKAGLVLVQEAFGVNAHMREVAERFAGLGYHVVVPAMYDRYERGFEVGYGEPEIARGIAMLRGLDWDKALLDIDAARAAVRAVTMKVGIVGYCFGGSMAWLSACRLSFDAAVCYYGSRIPAHAGETPRCPLIAHFGRLDKGIPLEGVEQVAAAHAQIPIYLYDAGHGFSCDRRPAFDRAAHDLAWRRTTEFFAAKLA
jgi:carboxymethylenebutenolidase